MRVWPGRRARRLGFGLEHVAGDFTFVGLGVGEGEGDGQPGGGADQMQAQTPEVAGVAGAVAVGGPAGGVGSLRGGPGAAALDGSRVDDPHVVAPPDAGHRQHPDHGLELVSRRPQPLVVAGLVGQIGKQVTEMVAGIAQPAGLRHEPGEGLQHRQRDQLGVGQLRPERTLRPGRRQGRVILQCVIDADVQCSSEGVQIGVHETSKVDGISNADRGRPRRVNGGYPQESIV